MSALSQILDSVPQDVLDGFRDDQPLTVSGLGGSKMEQQELVIVDKRGSPGPTEPLQPRTVTPMDLLAIATDQQADITKLQALWELQKEWKASEAREAFAVDFVNMKSHLPRVIRRKPNTQTNSMYAPLEDINREIDPILQEYGFSTATKILSQNEAGVTVQAELWHRGGHVERTQITMPMDTAGIKGTVNKTGPHALSSSVTYAKRVAICALLNISTGDDTDGNSSRERVGMPEDILNERLEWIENCRTLPELQKIFTEAYKLANAAQDKVAMAKLIKAKDARKKELQ
jgi:hypothetical protein